ncbi:hypothetical protein MKUB_50000 [Mycobacterium kubicae]|uniref:Uncharacterized protein n=1 Tax=Mycobacterium kubicae TaxID=120959 RepID=A0ABQ1BVI4_9MYCO|nr:hypothetical protein [Mycobacterium kubicae]OBF17678.1 hypothetical protein A5725_22590 [Mycobacterium kubicae]OBK56761.1 hypothetical protein A5657_09075 [Mycobacterium kubicae]ORV97641.1 hypothetical protein AWC13_15510 [Mycobacterium kubicae]GFG67510.1 hypothetical protein MKUB_50000 [Mycobacterium kubicae]
MRISAAEAIAIATDYIRQAGFGYPTSELAADRFESGWSVYAPVHVDTSDPASFLDMPVGRAVFLVGDSGRVEQVSSSTPPLQARQRFAEDERALAHRATTTDPGAFMTEFVDSFNQASVGQPVANGFAVLDGAPPPDREGARRDEEIGEQASAMLEPITQELALLGPPGWQEFTAIFALTVRAGSAECTFSTSDGWRPITVPQSVMDLVRAQREMSAKMSAGPWWRLMLTVTNQGQLRADYDYGDQPFPDHQLQPPENYRDDIAAYPRRGLPVWLAGYLAGPAAQGRTPAQASAAASADQAAGRRSTKTDELEPLPHTWARWAALAAVYTGARSQWGPRINPGIAWYESDARSGSTLYLLPGDRAVLSGGRWNSPRLVAAYQHGQPLPDLYCGAPAWVNDSVLNTRNQNGLLTFCYWWSEGHWWRGATDTFDELDDPLPIIWTTQETVDAMTAVVGPQAMDACQHLLAAAENRRVTRGDLATVFSDFGDPDLDTALNQLSLAGLAR